MKIINRNNKIYLPMIILAFFAYCGVGLLLQLIGINIFYDPLGLISTIFDWFGEKFFITLSLFGIALFPIYLLSYILFIKKNEDKLHFFFKERNIAVEWIVKIIIIYYFLKFIFLEVKVIPNILLFMDNLGLSFPKILLLTMKSWIPFFFFLVSLALLMTLFIKKTNQNFSIKVRWFILLSSFHLIFLTTGMIQLALLNPIQQIITKM